MRTLALVLLLAACGPGSRDAPRPIAPYPEATQDFRGGEDTMPPDDDDNDGIANDNDGCPLAAEPWDDPVKDGCPAYPAPDAGAR
jgi:hypothetical protein